MKRRNVSGADAMVVKELYQKMTTMATELNALRGRRNEITKHTKSAKSMEEKAILIEEAKALKQTIHERETALAAIDNQLLTEALQIPNDTSKDSPIGSEDCARVTKIVGKPIDPDNHPFPIADHLTLAKKHDMIDLETAALVSGASFYYLKNYGALLEVALIQYAMHKAVENGFSPVITPDIVRTSFAYSCGFQPRNNEMSQIYDVTTPTMDADSPALCLAGTAEVPLAGMFAKKIINEQELPKQMVGFGHAFRAEAGARGADTKGLYRVHQFSKVELFAVTRPDQSEAIMEKLLKLQEDIFTELGLCFRVLDMPSEELGGSANRKFDMEAWMPGRRAWGEISSTSNCTDYQARRLSIRYRPRESIAPLEFCHTLNGTAIAVPRVLIAIIENFQDKEGRIEIPSVLRKWLPGEPTHI
ncbi:seryl-tRNA synthetase [Umbelopsis sp. PMI_123]|nr:seryl-tRNA synthetase [Umbelopsis sp. PMI_123]